jgi:hypothetical protein
MAFKLVWRARSVRLVVPTCPESGFLERRGIWSGGEYCAAAGHRSGGECRAAGDGSGGVASVPVDIGAVWRQVTGVPVVAVRSA